jgi:3-isopropylmalate dehydrogenase
LEKTGRKLVDGLDLMVVRESTGGVTYEIERIGRVAFEFAGQRRNEVTSSDERNVMGLLVFISMRLLWRRG